MITCPPRNSGDHPLSALHSAQRINMKVKYLMLLSAAILLSITHPKSVRADDVIVSPSGDFQTIQAGINEANRRSTNSTETFRVVVQPGTYSGQFTAVSNIDIVGSSTAKTFFTGSSSIGTFSGVSNVTIRNFTFENGASISISGNSSVTVKNLVFNIAKTAITVASSPSTQIINNTFYGCTTAAISTDAELTAITNNIFSSNATAISAPSPLTHPTYNDFYLNTNNGIVANSDQHSLPYLDHTDTNPRFVKAGSDFHLNADSPAKGTGTGLPNPDGTAPDMGAYGGPTADVPPPDSITGVTATLSGSTITVTWNASSNSAVKGYRVYYGTFSNTTQGFPGYHSTGSPITVEGASTTSTTITKPQPVASLVTPVITSLEPQDRAIVVHWTQVENATEYLIYHSTSSISDSDLTGLTPDHASGTQTSKTISGLQNLTPYNFRVVAQADNNLFVAVTAVIDTSTAVAPAPGTSNESPYSEAASPIFIGDNTTPVVSTPSEQRTESPEAPSPFPDVKKGGCFIATAAYGFYSAPQVQALRLFRDRFLMTNPLGRAFVEWYYHYGPIGARFITEHPWLKPPVRLALLPLVLMAMFLVYLSPAAQVAILMGAFVVAAFLYQRSQQRRLLVQPGGMR
jgi:hypothetical protein